MFSVAKILELIAKSGYSIDELDRTTPHLYMLKENLECSKDEKGSIMRKFMESTMNFRQELIDGVKVFLEKDTTVLCIPDRDRNIVHLNVESPSKSRTSKTMKEYKRMVQSYISKERS
jgi:mannose-1-phosphate guanylyltransferase/phosphomannomutase